MSVAKKDLVKVVAVDCGMTLKNAETAVDCIVDFIKGAVKDGESVMIKGFGKFSRVVRAARKCKTPLGEVDVPERYAMKFHASGNFQDEVGEIEIAA